MLVKLDGNGPRYAQITRALRTSILNGDYPPGSRMPAIRELAVDLGVSRIVVGTAYDALAADGLLFTRTGAGTFVADNLPDKGGTERGAGENNVKTEIAVTNQGTPYLRNLQRQLSSTAFHANAFHKTYQYDLRSLWADMTPDLLKVWKRLASKSIERLSGRYELPQGVGTLRETVSDYFSFHENVSIASDRIFILSGRTQALDLIAKCLLGPDSVALLEDPGYQPFYSTIGAYGARMKFMPVDDNGFDVSEISLPPDLDNTVLFSSASHQYPTGSQMSISRKKSVLDWAIVHNVIIVDDPYDSQFRFETPHIPGFLSLDDKDRVFHLTSLSDNLFPGLAIVILIVPMQFAPTFVAANMYTEFGIPYLNQYIIEEFINLGEYGKHLRRLRNSYETRRGVLLKSLYRYFGDTIAITDPGVGRFVSVRFNHIAGGREEEIIWHAAEKDIALSGLGMHYRNKPQNAGFVLSVAQIDEEKIEKAVSLLADILECK